MKKKAPLPTLPSHLNDLTLAKDKPIRRPSRGSKHRPDSFPLEYHLLILRAFVGTEPLVIRLPTAARAHKLRSKLYQLLTSLRHYPDFAPITLEAFEQVRLCVNTEGRDATLTIMHQSYSWECGVIKDILGLEGQVLVTDREIFEAAKVKVQEILGQGVKPNIQPETLEEVNPEALPADTITPGMAMDAILSLERLRQDGQEQERVRRVMKGQVQGVLQKYKK